MKKAEYVTRAELSTQIDGLKKVFDIVRIVDPFQVSVIKDRQEEPVVPCYKSWDKNMRCANCISLKAYTNQERKCKFEFLKDQAFAVIAMPFFISDEGNRVVIVEMVNQLTNEIQVRTDGQNIIARTMNEIDHKLYEDALTGIYNRRYFEENHFIFKTKSILSRKFGFIIFDIKKFKHFNDSYGHNIGDVILKETAKAICSASKPEDACIRIGGDEFLVVIQNSDEAELIAAKQRIKEKVKEIEIPSLLGESIQINAGCSYTDQFDASKEQIKELYIEADKRMYEEKQQALNNQ